MMTLAKAAEHYATSGLHVFPLRPREKTPLTPHGHKDATTDLAQVRAWWDQWPDANIGLACGPSKIVVIDIDGDEGMASWDALAARLDLQVTTRVVRTGGGGLHLYFRAPGAAIRNSAGKLGRGIDVRGEGGYVVLPPSVHPSGRPYEWLNE